MNITPDKMKLIIVWIIGAFFFIGIERAMFNYKRWKVLLADLCAVFWFISLPAIAIGWALKGFFSPYFEKDEGETENTSYNEDYY